MPSDPLTYTCTCHQPGLVLLFYRYFTSPPQLPSPHYPLTTSTLKDLHAFQKSTCGALNLTGKIRVAKEGFNITVAGTTSDVHSYIESCISHWSFAGLDLSLDNEKGIKEFFKPTKGCACVFVDLNTRIADEITPLGITNYEPKNWNAVSYLSPAEFHDMVTTTADEEGERILLDIRNHYESRIGYFEAPEESGIQTVKPQVRRFSQFPAFVKKHIDFTSRSSPESEKEHVSVGKTIFSYCTGGIRCEKATRWIAENVDQAPQDRIYTLKGGISAYMAWFEEEMTAGRKREDECLWKGREYVFDGRGSLGLGNENERKKVAKCHGCEREEDRMGKCGIEGCELVLVVCEACEGVKCCNSCGDEDEKGRRIVCDCERQREFKLWGSEGMKGVKGVSAKQKKSYERGKKQIRNDTIDIRVRIVE
ncbi:hypothetical protein BELL_0379g00140 [Botrytis elliptica]|uniref:Rhodanese domain-containing protein n=1 Tax=Botrytis elliptica TaxID=278938 RepID=A0A4Z1JIT2_9HELO|nr:hypothetical protein EAE99_005543 [Botrytis elliptica]TGO73234.1 hypothetical protein BELL_0379g00140 [Botrytis elliptica]